MSDDDSGVADPSLASKLYDGNHSSTFIANAVFATVIESVIPRSSTAANFLICFFISCLCKFYVYDY